MRAPFRFVAIAAVALLPSPLPAAVLDGIELRLLANGLDSPVAIAHAGDDRIFVVEQRGVIRLVDAQGIASVPFLDLRERVQFGGEQGLLGLAFHPRYAENGRFFVNYTRDGDGATVVSRFERSDLDPDRGDPGSEAILLVIPQPFDNHNGGQLAFGPDGQLYVATGDGGAGGDPACRAQDIDDRLGKILRLDVDAHADSPPYHAASPGNPFVGAPGSDLVWALGLRNPWRFSFDRKSGDLYIADVGQGSWDEVDLQPADFPPPLNFGWKIMEGSACFSRDACPASTPVCGATELSLPILENSLAGANCAVIGGFAYRGHRLPALEGRYLFGDYCSGNIWAARGSQAGWIRDDLPFDLPTLTTFGETRVGEILLATQSGQLYALDRPIPDTCIPSPNRACLRDGRFEVEVSFRDYALERGDAAIVIESQDSALFWFFDPENWEQLVKVIDACGEPSPRYWVYGAAATDVETVVRVTDTLRGVAREYNNSLGHQAPALTDSEAFATCP